MTYELKQVAIRMVDGHSLISETPLKNMDTVIDVMHDYLKQMDREFLCVVNLNNNLQAINMNVVSIGTLNNCAAMPREVFKTAILSNAATIIMFHNHPSGNTTPSKADIDTTNRITEAGKIMGIPLLDHIILGSGTYYSFHEKTEYKYEGKYTQMVSETENNYAEGFTFQSGQKDVFVKTKYKNKTQSLAKKILNKLKLPDNPDTVKILLYYLTKAKLEIRTRSNGEKYYEIYGDNFAGKGSSVADGNTIVIDLEE